MGRERGGEKGGRGNGRGEGGGCRKGTRPLVPHEERVHVVEWTFPGGQPHIAAPNPTDTPNPHGYPQTPRTPPEPHGHPLNPTDIPSALCLSLTALESRRRCLGKTHSGRVYTASTLPDVLKAKVSREPSRASVYAASRTGRHNPIYSRC